MPKYNHQKLIDLATQLLTKSGLPEDRAQVTAKTLVEADLMGHFTHGLALLNPYLSSIENGGMKLDGDPETLMDTGSTANWNGQYLPGCWLLDQAIELGLKRVKHHPVFTLTIQQCHHIGALAAYPERATKNGLVMILSCSDPSHRSVAPFGGREAKYSPNPMAFGFPTEGDPIIMDISMSATAMGLINQKKESGEKLPQPWLQDAEGKPTADPNDFFAEPPGAIMPLGGKESGYKGFALGMMVELLTSGLAGHGRSEKPEKWGCSVFIQIIDPKAFGGIENFKKQAQFLTNEFSSTTPIDPNNPVRIPGHRALKMKNDQLKSGVELSQSILKSLAFWAQKLDIPFDN